MDSNNHNNDGAKSQIEKIRIDLEKKLAALEAAKIKTSQRKSINQENSNVNEVKSVETNTDNRNNTKDIVDNQRFVEQLSKLEIVNIPKKVDGPTNVSKEKEVELINTIKKEIVVDGVSADDTLFEIHDKIESIKEKIADVKKTITNEKSVSNTIQNTGNVKPSVEKNIKEDESIGLTAIPNTPVVSELIAKITEPKTQTKNTIQKTAKISKNKVVSVIANVVSKTNKNVKVNDDDNENNEEGTKKSNLNYIIYALAGIILMAVSYMSWSYFSNSPSGSGNKVLSEYENRRYKDSIELADLSNQLLDFQSQRYIDSIAIANQIQLENTSSKNNLKETFADNISSTNNVSNSSNFNKPVQQITNNDINVVADDTRLNNEVIISSNDNNTILGTSIPSDNNTVLVTEQLKEEVVGEKLEIENKEEKIDNTEEKSTEIEELKKETESKNKKTETLSTIDKSPIYPGCEGESSELLKKRCLMSKISKFVSNKFNSDLSQDLGLEEGRKKINVSFIIDKFGGVTVLKVRGQHKVLEKEALRVVNSLPKMKPGQKNGNAEPVLYNLPIIYKVEY